jgi:leucyl aminopeptidase
LLNGGYCCLYCNANGNRYNWEKTQGGCMQITVTVGTPLEHPCRVLVVGCHEQEGVGQELAQLDEALAGSISLLLGQREFTGKLLTTKLLHTLGRLPAERLLLVGLGKRDELTQERLRRAAGAAAQALRQHKLPSATSLLHQALGADAAAVDAAVTGLVLGNYSFDDYKSDRTELVSLAELQILIPAKAGKNEVASAVVAAQAVCNGVILARNLVSEPGNVATPDYLAAQALELARLPGVSCQVFTKETLEQLGMGGLLAVGKGSVLGPRFIVLEYDGGGAAARPVVLVGKGITFDSGGISLKPREGMEAMKTDMAGAAAVLGCISAVAELRLPCSLVGLIPTAENLPDGGAYKPGDVIKTMAGKTVEINNTDAEGRLILCDALHYAQRYKPAALIDLATLTGACVVALGHQASGLLGNDAGLKRTLQKAGETSGERLWELPLWEEYGEAMKSDIADLKNAGGPTAGTITAGWFLEQFVGLSKWAHLDIAGTAWEDKGRHYLPKGATGVGVRLLLDYLRALAK